MQHAVKSALLSLAIFVFPAEDLKAATVSVKDSILEVQGTIAAGDGEAFEKALVGGIKFVRIRSPGGLLPEALRIGRALQERGIDLEISGLCASACAQLILPGAKTVRIADGSIIAMHAAAEGALLSAQREGSLDQIPERILDKLVPAFKLLRSDMLAYFQSTGVDERAMDFMYALTSITSVIVTYTEESDTKFNFQLNGQQSPVCRVWLLNAESLTALGVKAPNWKAAGRLKAALVLGEQYDQIYDGPVLSGEVLSATADCSKLRRLVPERSAPK